MSDAQLEMGFKITEGVQIEFNASLIYSFNHAVFDSLLYHQFFSITKTQR